MNGLVIAREVADELHLKVDDGILGWMMWNETGWPAFFNGDPETTYRKQIRVALLGITKATE